MTKLEDDTTALTHFQGAPSDAEIDRIRRAGAQTVAMRKEIGELYRQLDGMEWGSGSQIVKGSAFSQGTRYAIAKFCAVTGANPMTQVDILGGKPYLNANFWSDKVANDPFFISFDQEDISPSMSVRLREQSTQVREAAADVKEVAPERYAEMIQKSVDFLNEATRLDDLRRQWNAPAWAQVVVLTEITRLIPAAPIEKIKEGEVANINQYLTTISECNWAGGRPMQSKRGGGEYQPDPVGQAEPEKSARTRSFRRCATRSFAAWMPKFEQQVQKAQDIIEAEWDLVTTEAAAEVADLPADDEPQAVNTNGEATAAKVDDAEDLPVAEPVVTSQPATTAPVAEPVETEAPASPLPEDVDTTQDIARYREAFFGGLKAAGIEEKDRKAWAKMNGLPESTKKWGQAEFQKANELLLVIAKDRFADACKKLGRNKKDLANEVIEHEPTTLDDYYRLMKELDALGINSKAPAVDLPESESK